MTAAQELDTDPMLSADPQVVAALGQFAPPTPVLTWDLACCQWVALITSSWDSSSSCFPGLGLLGQGWSVAVQTVPPFGLAWFSIFHPSFCLY